jgi:hypothetical protein
VCHWPPAGAPYVGGLTLADLAEMIEAEAGFPVAPGVVSRWERGLILPGPRRGPALVAVAKALLVPYRIQDLVAEFAASRVPSHDGDDLGEQYHDARGLRAGSCA